MLLGDRVERMMKMIGADKVAKMYEQIGRKPCGCAGRKAALNEWHRKAAEWLETNK